MQGSRVVFAAILGLCLAFGSAPARAESIFDAIAKAFQGDGGGGLAFATPGQALYPEMVPRSRVVPFNFKRQLVRYQTIEQAGTIIIDTRAHYLYFILGNGQAIRYGVGVGRTGFGWKGTVKVGAKQEWPDWIPPKEMISREAKRGHRLPARMAGGPGNPLGARALYLHGTGGDTGYRIHGTSEPWTIGLNVSSGCVRLVNDDVIDLYQRARIGAKVIVL
jgi:lipoprotein-anchoring transpeptidase ErfK/SrfK